MSDVETGPAAQGVRVDYDDLPSAVRAWIDSELGGRVVEAVTQPGGFSPGVAARVRTDDGRRAFVKAVSGDVNPDTPRLHRREIAVTGALPSVAPAPRLLASYDDGTWVALLLADVDGRHPVLPWEDGELRRVVATIDELAVDLTPCPLPDAQDVGPAWRPEFDKWRESAGGTPPAGLDPWARTHLDRLAVLEDGWEAATAGDTLLHLDLRADNMLVTDERIWLVDWPWAARGHPLFDLAAFCPSVAMQGGPQPPDLLAMSAVGRAAERERLLALVAAIAGYLCVHALRPPPPGLPTVRAFQAAQGEVALRWLRDLTGW
jgi:aminoglycoside phosphotransferase (APT) family kinase protein